MSNENDVYRRLHATVGASSFAALAEMAGGPGHDDPRIVWSAALFGLCLPIAAYLYNAGVPDTHFS